MERPKVSIIMATYNRSHFIIDALDAVKNQSLQGWECLVIDDGSSDDTEKVVEDFRKTDSRIKFERRSKEYQKGLPGCRNYGLDQARGEYVIFLDDDDISHPQLLEITIEEIEKHKVDFCRYLRRTFTGEFTLDFKKISSYEVIQQEEIVREMITGELPFNSCQVLWKISCFKEIRFDEDLMFAEEWECYTRILLQEVRGVTVDQPLFFARKHLSSNTGEYNQKNEIRLESHRVAAIKIIQALKEKDKFDIKLKNFFIRLGFKIKSPALIETSIAAADGNFYEKMKYQIGFRIYPIIRPFFILKQKISGS